MSSTPSHSWSVCSGLVLTLALATAGGAQNLTLYDGLDYGVTGANTRPLAGQTGGFGWGGPWLGSGLDGLASWWPLDGNAGDAGPFGSDGIMTSAAYIFDTPNIVWSTHSIQMKSSQRGRVDLSAHVHKYRHLMRGSITLWARSTKKGPLMTMVGGVNKNTNRSLQLYVRDGFVHYDVNGDLPSINLMMGGTDVSDGVWHHIAVTVDETGFATIYVDGAFEISAPQGFFGHIYDMQHLWIGRVEFGSPSRHFDGELDDVAIWGSVLSATEVQALANLPPPLVAVPARPLGPTLKSESLPTSSAPSGAFGTFGLGQEGNRLGDSTGYPAYRRIAKPINLDGNEVHYLSCLMQLASPGTDPAFELQLTDELGSHVRVGWNSALKWIAGYDKFTPGPTAFLNTPYFVVLKIEPLNAGNDTISMKVYAPGETVHADDSLLSGMGAAVNNWSIIHATEALINEVNAIGLVPLGSGASVDVDEIRIGWSWESVTSLGYGKGCLGAAIGKSNRLQIGSTDFAVKLSGASPNQAAFLALGGSRTVWGAALLPFDLTAAGAPGCQMLASFDSTLPTMTNGSGTASITLPAPNVPALIGRFLFLQWASVDANMTNPLPLAFSNGLEAPFEG